MRFNQLVAVKGMVFLSFFLTAAVVPAKEVFPSTIVNFVNSCQPASAGAINHAVTMLHSFEYPESEKRFRRILLSDPGCAIARWGIAMSLWHPIWAPPDAGSLAAGREILAGVAQLDMSIRERSFVDAITEFYSNSATLSHNVRAKKYALKMENVYLENLDDPEATTFYALAILGTVDPQDKTYALQYKAGAILNWVKASHPRHPGVLHYIIHSYDYPGLAHLALAEAHTYAQAAPDSAHAQHMPSHIFTRLGLWENSIRSNADSTASAAAYTRSAHLPGHYDEGLHSIDYLMYAYLQTGRDKDAKALLETLRGIGLAHPENFKVAFTLASSPARYALERRSWAEAGELQLLRVNDFNWRDFGWARSIHHFARGLGAARSNNVPAAKKELAELKKIRDSLGKNTLPYWREEVSVQLDSVASWIALAEGDTGKAVELARAAADREDSVDKHPVTPGEVLPARELLADMFFELGRYEDALLCYEQGLKQAPNRYNGLLGAARAAKHSGDIELAKAYYNKLLKQANSESNRKSLDEAKQFIRS